MFCVVDEVLKDQYFFYGKVEYIIIFVMIKYERKYQIYGINKKYIRNEKYIWILEYVQFKIYLIYNYFKG